MKQKHFTRIASILIAFVFAITIFVPSKAIANIDQEKECTLNIHFEPGVSKFYLYKIAEIDQYTHFTIDPTFEGFYTGDLNGLDAVGYVSLANELKSIIHLNNIEPVLELTTDEAGNATAENLLPGMYLLRKPQLENDPYGEGVQIFTLPINSELDEEGKPVGDWIYNPLIEVKVPPRGDLNTSIEVEKQWDFSKASDLSQTKKNNLKKEVVVKLLVDQGDGTTPWPVYKDDSGKDYSHIVLNEENNWKQVLENVNLIDGTWEFEEVDPGERFAVSTYTEGNVTVVTNTYKPEEETPTTEPDKPSTTTTTEKKKTTETTTRTKLPQTGQLWWPVPILAIIGLIFFVVGALKNKNYHKKNNENS